MMQRAGPRDARGRRAWLAPGRAQSPHHREIVPRKAIVDMVRDGICVICSGGGGVPVVRAKDGTLSGVDAVIDKDLAAAVLAKDVAADVLLILTDVPQAYINYNTPEQKALDTVSFVGDGALTPRPVTSRPAPWARRSTHACGSWPPAAQQSSPVSRKWSRDGRRSGDADRAGRRWRPRLRRAAAGKGSGATAEGRRRAATEPFAVVDRLHNPWSSGSNRPSRGGHAR